MTKNTFFAYNSSIFALSFFCLVSCIKKTNSLDIAVTSDDKITIDVQVNSDFLNIIDVVDSVTYIPLETTDECLIGEINKIQYSELKFYILDRVLAKSLYIFDSTGHFERKIGNIGQGVGEYIQPTDFVVLSTHIVILDQFSHRLLFYNKLGEFSHSVKLDYKIHRITSLNDSTFVAQAGDNRFSDLKDYEILVINKNGEVNFKGIKNPYRMNYDQAGYCQLINDKVIYAKAMAGDIYEITENELKERYHINILNNPLPQNYEKLCDGNYEYFMDNFLGHHNSFSGNFIETDNIVCFFITNTEKYLVSVFYNKNTKKIKSGILSLSSDDMKLLPNKWLGHLLVSLNGYLTVSNNDIIGYIDGFHISDKEDPNPVLFFLSLK